MNKQAHGQPGTGTAQRVLTLLSFLADAEGPVAVRQVADALGLAPSTTHRLLNLLVGSGFASHEPGSARYAVGPEYDRVAHRVGARVSPAQVARGVIAALAQRYDETVLFGMLLPAQERIAFAARADGQKKLLYRIDMHVPLSLVWGASGRAALAYLPEEKVACILAGEGASPATGDGVPAMDDLRAALAAVRETGFCVSHGEKLPGALGIAAPVFGPVGVIGTICMTMPKDRAPSRPASELGAEVAQAAADLTAQLGGRAP